MDWATWWCVLCANLPPQSRLFVFVYFFIGLFACSLSVTTRSLIRALLCTCESSRHLAVTVWTLGQLVDWLVLWSRTVIFLAQRFVSAMTRVSPRRSRPCRLTTALRIVSATIGASSCRSSPRNLISRCPLVSGNWASGFFSPVSALEEAGRGSNARSVLCLASELHLQQAMTSVDRQERGQWTPDTSHLWLTSLLTCHPPLGLPTVRGESVLPTWFLSVSKLLLPPHHPPRNRRS